MDAMKMINRVLDEKRADYCDQLLTKLILDEKKYDLFRSGDSARWELDPKH